MIKLTRIERILREDKQVTAQPERDKFMASRKTLKAVSESVVEATSIDMHIDDWHQSFNFTETAVTVADFKTGMTTKLGKDATYKGHSVVLVEVVNDEVVLTDTETLDANKVKQSMLKFKIYFKKDAK